MLVLQPTLMPSLMIRSGLSDGNIDVTDVQRAILIVLYTITGDNEIEGLLGLQDPDLDLIHNSCDIDDDNDTFADLCEVNQGTDPLNASNFPADSDACNCPGGCDDGNACSVDICDTDSGTCVSVAGGTVCDDGDSCTDGDYCDGLIVCRAPQNCDDGNACTTDSQKRPWDASTQPSYAMTRTHAQLILAPRQWLFVFPRPNLRQCAGRDHLRHHRARGSGMRD